MCSTARLCHDRTSGQHRHRAALQRRGMVDVDKAMPSAGHQVRTLTCCHSAACATAPDACCALVRQESSGRRRVMVTRSAEGSTARGCSCEQRGERPPLILVVIANRTTGTCGSCLCGAVHGQSRQHTCNGCAAPVTRGIVACSIGPSGPQFHLIAADSLARHCELSNEWRTRSDCYEISCDRPEIMFLMFFSVDQCDDDIY